MLRALRYEILRDVKVPSTVNLPEEPIRVCSLMDEKTFIKLNGGMIHLATVFFEEKFHDWNWAAGKMRFYTRIAESTDVLVVYEEESVPFGKKDPRPEKQ